MVSEAEIGRLVALIEEAVALADRCGLASTGIWLDRALVSVTEGPPIAVVELCDDAPRDPCLNATCEP